MRRLPIRPLLAASTALLVATIAAIAAANAPCDRPAADDDWPVAAPEAVGFDARALCAVLEDAAVDPHDLHAVLVERHGRLVAELYRSGPDTPIDVRYGLPRPFAPDTAFDANALHDVRSISKSVVGLLVGIAVRDGKIASLSAPALDSFPELVDLHTSGRDAITIENLLTMSSGLDWNEWDANTFTSDETRLFWTRDQVRFFYDRPLVAPPGTRFNYNGGGTATLAELLTRATGRPLRELAREQLFEPLGITQWVWAGDLRGRPLAFAGLRLRPRDLAKLGRLVIQGGRWRDRQVVPASWIAESLRSHVETKVELAPGYGYQWWAGHVESGGRDLPWSMGVGNGGQRLFVVPDLDLTVVTTAGEYGHHEIGAMLGRMMGRIVASIVP